MFAPREFPCCAWMSVLDTNLMQVVVIPVTLLGYNTTTKHFAAAEVTESVHQDFICESQVSAIQHLVRVIDVITTDKMHPIHHMTPGLLPVHAALVASLAIMKARAI